MLRMVVVCLIVLGALPGWAEEPGLVTQIGTKFVRGVANIATGWVELPKQVYVVGTNEGWVAGVFRGPFDGIGMFAARTIAGAYELLTFPVPVPPHYQPMMQPEYVWDKDPPGSPKESSSPSDKTSRNLPR
jgi:putative exosortase-associated protein (TIGR04073 family)